MSHIDHATAGDADEVTTTPKMFATEFMKGVNARGDARPVEVRAERFEISAKDRPVFEYSEVYEAYRKADWIDRQRILHAALNRWEQEMGPDPGAEFRDAVASKVQKFVVQKAIEKTLNEDNGPAKPRFPNQWRI